MFVSPIWKFVWIINLLYKNVIFKQPMQVQTLEMTSLDQPCQPGPVIKLVNEVFKVIYGSKFSRDSALGPCISLFYNSSPSLNMTDYYIGLYLPHQVKTHSAF